jgi:hypothetical protein
MCIFGHYLLSFFGAAVLATSPLCLQKKKFSENKFRKKLEQTLLEQKLPSPVYM